MLWTPVIQKLWIKISNLYSFFITSRLVQYWYFLLKSIFFPLIKIFFWDKSVSSVTDFTSRSGQRKICHSKSFVPSKEKTSVESILVLGHILFKSKFFLITINFYCVRNDPHTFAGRGVQNLGISGDR